MKKYTLLALTLVAAMPLSAFAAFETLDTYVRDIRGIVNILIPLVVAVALLVFFWGLVKFIYRTGNEDAKEDGKRLMIWGIIALFVMVSIWGIVNIIYANLGLTDDRAITPCIPGVADCE